MLSTPTFAGVIEQATGRGDFLVDSAFTAGQTGQSFTAIDTNITQVAFGISGAGPALTIQLYAGIGNTGVPITSETVSIPAGLPAPTAANGFNVPFTSFDFAASGLTVGAAYTLWLTTPTGSGVTLTDSNKNPYSAGNSLGAPTPRTPDDLKFKVVGETATIDQPTGRGDFLIYPLHPAGQVFTATDTTISDIAFGLSGVGPSFTVQLFAGIGAAGVPLATQTFAVPTGLTDPTVADGFNNPYTQFHFPVSGLTVGAQYTLWLTTPDGSSITVTDSNTNPYAMGGLAVFPNQEFEDDLKFRVVGNSDVAASIPEPAPWTMLLGGIGVMGVTLRRKQVVSAAR